MIETLTLTIELSPETREFIRSRIERGDYASESDLIAKSIESLKEESEELERCEQNHADPEFEEWFQQTIPARLARYKSNPGTAIPSEQVKRNLEERRKRRGAVTH